MMKSKPFAWIDMKGKTHQYRTCEAAIKAAQKYSQENGIDDWYPTFYIANFVEDKILCRVCNDRKEVWNDGWKQAD